MFRYLVISSITILSSCALTPEPFNESQLDLLAEERAQELEDNLLDVGDRPITLYEAMAMALRHNLDARVELFEEALLAREFEQARFDQLPQLIAGAAYNGRDVFSGASSSQLNDTRSAGDQSLVGSTSSERNTFTSDVQLSWDVLDFGLSYVRAKQRADEILISQERRRRVMDRVMQDVRTAYWRAVSSEKLMSSLLELESDVKEMIRLSNNALERQQSEPLSALTAQRSLLAIKEEIGRLREQMIVSKKQLAALINLDPGVDFRIAVPEKDEVQFLDLKDPSVIVGLALRNRSELRESAYQRRISEEEATAAVLELLPSLRLFGGFNYDSNDFLVSNNWLSWGARASWNLLNVFQLPARQRTIEANQLLLEQQELALAMAITTQVHVGISRYELARTYLDDLDQYKDIQSRILDQIVARSDAGQIGRQQLIREQMNSLVVEAKYDLALAELQSAFGNIYSSIGSEPLAFDVKEDDTIETLAAKIEKTWHRRGDIFARGGV